MIIMDPNDVMWRGYLFQVLGKTQINILIDFKILRLIIHKLMLVMHQRPQCIVGKTTIKTLILGLSQWTRVIFNILMLQDLKLLLFRLVNSGSIPANPDTAYILQSILQCYR